MGLLMPRAWLRGRLERYASSRISAQVIFGASVSVPWLHPLDSDAWKRHPYRVKLDAEDVQGPEATGASADLREAVDALLACLERHEFSRSFADGAGREALLKARDELNVAFAAHLGEPDTYARRRRIVEIAEAWLTEAKTGTPAFHHVAFQKTKALLENVAPAFAELNFEKAAALVKPSPQGPTGARAVASRWAFAVGAFASEDAFSDRTQEQSDKAFMEATKAARRKSRAKTG